MANRASRSVPPPPLPFLSMLEKLRLICLSIKSATRCSANILVIHSRRQNEKKKDQENNPALFHRPVQQAVSPNKPPLMSQFCLSLIDQTTGVMAD